MSVILIAGTGQWTGSNAVDWYQPGSPFATMLSTAGKSPYFGNGRPYEWSTGLGGIWGGSQRKLSTWDAAGINLFAYIVPPEAPSLQLPPATTCLIAHSHGLQVALFACQHGLLVHTLISVGSPIRSDVAAATPRARANIAYWLHIHSDDSDRWQWLGELGEGWPLHIVRQAPLADRNDFIPGVGHTSLLRDPTKFHFWPERHWLYQLV